MGNCTKPLALCAIPSAVSRGPSYSSSSFGLLNDLYVFFESSFGCFSTTVRIGETLNRDPEKPLVSFSASALYSNQLSGPAIAPPRKRLTRSSIHQDCDPRTRHRQLCDSSLGPYRGAVRLPRIFTMDSGAFTNSDTWRYSVRSRRNDRASK